MNGEPFRGPLEKPEPRAKAKRRRDRQRADAWRRCKAIVYQRAGMRCQRCGVPVSIAVHPADPRRAHINHRNGRRGDRLVDPENCELLCQSCHLPNGQHAPTAERLNILRGPQ